MIEWDNRIKYNFNYLKKNIDITKFLKLATKYKWNFNDETDILDEQVANFKVIEVGVLTSMSRN